MTTEEARKMIPVRVPICDPCQRVSRQPVSGSRFGRVVWVDDEQTGMTRAMWESPDGHLEEL